jgi:bacteriocin-like protein
MKKKKERIKIRDLPKDTKITKKEMKKIIGGIDTVPLPEAPRYGRGTRWSMLKII